MHSQSDVVSNTNDLNGQSLPVRSVVGEQSGVRMVVGGNRGIGLALVEAQLAMADVNRVIATYRPGSETRKITSLERTHGNRLLLQPLDVTDEESIGQFTQFVADQTAGIDLTICATGLLHDDTVKPEKSLVQCDAVSLKRLFEVNSIGPLMVARALLPVYQRKRRFTFAALSAMVGSIEDNRLGGWYGYRASKAALNQFIKTLSNECRFKFPRASIVAVHPGTTDTRLSRPFQRNIDGGRLYSVDQTAKRILGVLESLEVDQTGMFLNWDGSTIPW